VSRARSRPSARCVLTLLQIGHFDWSDIASKRRDGSQNSLKCPGSVSSPISPGRYPPLPARGASRRNSTSSTPNILRLKETKGNHSRFPRSGAEESIEGLAKMASAAPRWSANNRLRPPRVFPPLLVWRRHNFRRDRCSGSVTHARPPEQGHARHLAKREYRSKRRRTASDRRVVSRDHVALCAAIVPSCKQNPAIKL
jgi:hypothetical protein